MVKLVDTLYLATTKAHPQLPLPQSTLVKKEVTQAGQVQFSKNTLAAIQALNTRLTYKNKGLFSGPPPKTVKRAQLIRTN